MAAPTAVSHCADAGAAMDVAALPSGVARAAFSRETRAADFARTRRMGPWPLQQLASSAAGSSQTMRESASFLLFSAMSGMARRARPLCYPLCPMHRIFVYGTLRPGAPNHGLMERLGAQCVRQAVRTRETMGLVVAGIRATPYLFALDAARGGVSVVGDLFLVDDAALRELDDFEGVDGGHYARVAVHVDGEEATADCYLLTRQDKIDAFLANGQRFPLLPEYAARFHSVYKTRKAQYPAGPPYPDEPDTDAVPPSADA